MKRIRLFAPGVEVEFANRDAALKMIAKIPARKPHL